MGRPRLAPGQVGKVTLTPVGHRVDDASRKKVVIPALSTDGGDPLPYPKSWRAGEAVKVPTELGLDEFVINAWRGDARVRDVDGRTIQVRCERPTRSAAESGTRQVGLDRLASLAQQREQAAAVAAEAARTKDAGDTTTTVADLVARVLDAPAFAKLAGKTQQDYRYASRHILDDPIAALLPRDVDVAAVRRFFEACAQEHGRGGAKHARAVLSRALSAATESAALKVPFNPVQLAKDSIPDVKVRETGLDHTKAPTTAEVETLLAALRSDPAALPMTPGKRHKSGHGAAGTGRVNGADIADLALLLFHTGARIGEVAALRWADLDFEQQTIEISGTLSLLAGQGTVRQNKTKTRSSTRAVPMSPDVVAALAARAEFFGFDPADPAIADRPVFGSPQRPESWRDYRNLSRSIKTLFTKHGLEYARGHAGRKWRVTSLVERGVSVHKAADFVRHGSVKTTFGYLGRGRQTDDDVRAAL
jgi:integrase